MREYIYIYIYIIYISFMQVFISNGIKIHIKYMHLIIGICRSFNVNIRIRTIHSRIA